MDYALRNLDVYFWGGVAYNNFNRWNIHHSNVVGTRYPTKTRSSSNVVGTRYPTKTRSSSNVGLVFGWGLSLNIGGLVKQLADGDFFFLSDEYFSDFPDGNLMINKESVNGIPHGRPCFFAFKDPDTDLLWMIPISSRVEKYRQYEKRKIQRYGRCDTILFGNVLGHEKAFLIQNMCPVTKSYISGSYVDAVSKSPVRVDGAFKKELIKSAIRVLEKTRQGIDLIFPDVLSIEKLLLNRENDID